MSFLDKLFNRDNKDQDNAAPQNDEVVVSPEEASEQAPAAPVAPEAPAAPEEEKPIQ